MIQLRVVPGPHASTSKAVRQAAGLAGLDPYAELATDCASIVRKMHRVPVRLRDSVSRGPVQSMFLSRADMHLLGVRSGDMVTVKPSDWSIEFP